MFAAQPGVLGDDRAAAVDEAATFLKQQEDNGVVVRGLYDVAGMRADADFMIWTHAERVESLQATYSDFRRTTALGRAVEPVWSSVALHRPAEFNKATSQRSWRAKSRATTSACTPSCGRWTGTSTDDERRKMLADHGMAARGYKGRPSQHCARFRARRLRMDSRVRGARTASHCRPDA